MSNRPTKFRQYIGKTRGWHYWGYLDGTKNSFTTPLSSTDDNGEIPDSTEYTGLTDKNGKEIWEGDAVKYKVLSGFDCGWNEDFEGGDKNSSEISEETKEVKFINGQFWPRHYSNLIDDGYYSWRLFDLEVIGNIYENPELLK